MRILAGVYNAIENDGRVLRETAALTRLGNVTLACTVGGHGPAEIESCEIVRFGRSRRNTSRWPGHLSFWTRFTLLAIRLKPDVIHAHDFFLALPGWFAARVTGARLVFDAHELMIVEPHSRTVRNRVWALLQGFAVRHADLVIAPTAERARFMREHHNLNVLPLVVANIPPSSPAIPHECKARLEFSPPTPDGFVAVYEGFLSLGRGIGRFIDATIVESETGHMVLIGTGPDINLIRSRYRCQIDSGRLHVLGQVPRDELECLLKLCDVGVVTYANRGLNNIYCAPNKVYEYAMSGVPIVGTNQPPIAHAIDHHGLGEVIPTEMSPQGIAGVLERVAKHKHEYQDQLRDFVCTHRWEDEALRLIDGVSDLHVPG